MVLDFIVLYIFMCSYVFWRNIGYNEPNYIEAYWIHSVQKMITTLIYFIYPCGKIDYSHLFYQGTQTSI